MYLYISIYDGIQHKIPIKYRNMGFIARERINNGTTVRSIHLYIYIHIDPEE